MKIAKRSLLKFPDNREKTLALFQIEAKCFRWIEEATGKPLNGVDYLSEHDAVKGLRVLVEGDPAYVGVDMTVLPVELPPAERAAKRIVDLELDELNHIPEAIAVEKMANAIAEETAIDKLVEAVNLYITYRFPRLRFPKAAGLDMTEGGLVLGVIEALEISMKVDLSNLKAKLTEGIEQVKVYSSIPTGPKGVN